MTTDVDDFLAHYGVLGMKWGVRKDRRTARAIGVTDLDPGGFGERNGAKVYGTSKDVSRRASTKAAKTALAVRRRLLDRSGPAMQGLAEFNAQSERNNDSLEQYNSALEAYFNKHLKSIAPKGFSAATVITPEKLYLMVGQDVDLSVYEEFLREELKHALNDAVILALDVQRTADGQIVGLSGGEKTLSPEEFSSLTHYGVLGMKWGVRKDRRTGRRTVSPDAIARRNRRKAVKRRRSLSNEEIQARIERIQLEKKLKDLTADDISPGRKFAGEIMKSSGRKVLGTVVTGAMMYAVKVALEGKWDAKTAAQYLAPKLKK